MIREKIIHTLENLGLSTYEAKAYLAILYENPITGYKLSKISGVPRSRIYETIERLIAKGLVISQMGETILLKPASVETFLEKKESESRQNIEFLRQTLADVERPTEDQRIWNISGCERIFELIQTLISQTKRNVYLLGFGQDIKIFEKALHKAEKRRVKIYGVYCGEEPALMKNLLYHQGQLCSICQEIAISFDSKQAVVGSTYPPESAFAALTANPGIIYIIEQYIKHEIFISELFETYPQPSLEKMKEIYQQVMKKLP